MEKFIPYFNFIYLLTTGAISIFYGLFAVKIFWGEKVYKDLPKYKLAREVIFNFSGMALGFSVLYFLIRKAMFCISANQYNCESIIDVLLLIIALLGISGYLPATALKITEGIGLIIDKLMKVPPK